MEYAAWLAGQAAGPEADGCLKLLQQCGGWGAYAPAHC
jgi:hypothetical protein